jgi:predicted ATPase
MPQPADLHNDFLLEDARNLGLVLNRLSKDAKVKRTLLEYVKKFYEGIEDIAWIIEGGTVQIFLQEGNYTIPATRLSDGTLRWLSLLSILLHPSPPPLVCIEEPEIGLHPDMLRTLAQLLLDASSRMQLVVTTHSDALIDAINESPESVIVCEKKAGTTVLSRLSKDELAAWLGKYTLGQLWRRGDIGGNRF